MEVIRAPWRMRYIDAASKPNAPEQSGCFLCAYVGQDCDEENLVVARGVYSYVLMNRYPYSTGHLMVTPYRHTSDLADLRPEEFGEMFSFSQTAVRVLKQIMNADGFNLGMNLGKVAGAGLDSHLHLHIVPRWSGDTNFMSVTAETKVLPQALSETYKRLMAAWT